ncbi:hypothetical protein ACP6L2_01380 [Sphingobacterium lactis]
MRTKHNTWGIEGSSLPPKDNGALLFLIKAPLVSYIHTLFQME